MEFFVSTLSYADSRNAALFDVWSVIHLLTAALLVIILRKPLIALAITVLWEPFEIFLLSPLLKRYDIVFGFEAASNSVSDIIFDAAGVVLGVVAVKLLFSKANVSKSPR